MIPDTIKNGKVKKVSERQISYKCDPGFFLSTETQHFICKNDGNWNSDDLNPQCIKCE